MVTATPSRARNALLAGATGLVGRALLPLLLDSDRYQRVHALVRRPVPGITANARLQLHSVDFAHLHLPLPAVDDVFITLGTTLAVAGSEAAFRQVDFDFVVDTARAARAAGARRLAVVSALGADTASRVLYNRVKGEMEAAVVLLGYDSVAIARPSLLLGDRSLLGQPPRTSEIWTVRLLAPFAPLLPAGMRPLQAQAVAAALLAAVTSAEPGVRLLRSRDMLRSAGR